MATKCFFKGSKRRCQQRDCPKKKDTFHCYLCDRPINNLRSGLEGHILNYHGHGSALDENGQPVVKKKVVRRRTVNNNTIQTAKKKSKKGGSKKKKNAKKTTNANTTENSNTTANANMTTNSNTTANANMTTNANTTTILPVTTSSLPDTDDYPVPYDNFFYKYTFSEYESLILNCSHLTPTEENHQSGPTTTATSTETSAAVDQDQNTSQPGHQFKIPEVPPLHFKSNTEYRNYLMTGAYASGSAGVNETGDAIKTLGSDDEVVVDDFLRGGYVYADEHLWEKFDYTSFTS